MYVPVKKCDDKRKKETIVVESLHIKSQAKQTPMVETVPRNQTLPRLHEIQTSDEQSEKDDKKS